ncbi:MAG: hypothetical protein AAB869_03235 [Patescibacteria group bacterium]
MTEPIDGDTGETETREELEYSLRTFYIVAKCNAFWTTLFLISTFVAETVLNTIRLNEKLKNVFEKLLDGWQLITYFQGFYPSGDKPIEIVAGAHVYIYIFAVALYAGLRLVHHKTLVGKKYWPGSGKERKKNLGVLSLFTRWCWHITPKKRVHQYVMRMWMWWGVVPLVVTFPLSWLGIRVFTSENLFTALVGSFVLFGVSLIEDSEFFKKVPARDVLGRVALSLITLGAKRDFTVFAKEMTELASGIQSGKIEATPADLDYLRRVVEWADNIARNPACDMRPPLAPTSEHQRERVDST